MEKRNPNLCLKEGHQPRDRIGGRARGWDGTNRTNTVPKQLPPFPSSRPHHRQPQESQGRSLHGDRPSSPSSALSSRSIRSPPSLAQGAQGKGPPWSRGCARRPSQPGGLANSTAARSKRRRVSCWACSGMVELEPQQQYKDQGWMDETSLVPHPCSHIISHISASVAATSGSQVTPANTPLSFQAYEGESFPGPQQEVSRWVKQETQTETLAQEADSAVSQYAEKETQTEKQDLAAPLLVNKETQTETPAQEKEKSASLQLINEETQSETPVPSSPSAHSSALLTGIDAPARRQRLPLFRWALRTLRWASRCPCMARHPEATGARRDPGDGCCSEPAKHPRGGAAGTGTGTGVGAARPAFPGAEGSALPPYSWPWLIETSL